MGLKYCHVVNNVSPPMKVALEEIPRRGGMYNWLFLFKGAIRCFRDMTKEDYDSYDVIQVNMSPVDQILIREIRDIIGNNTSTLLIGNNDYVTEAWDTWGQHPLEYQQTMKIPDAIFGTEPHQTSYLREDAYCIPHPHWIKMLKHIGNDDLKEGSYKIAALYHWWEGRSYHASALLHRLRRDFPKVESRLYGYTGEHDRCRRWMKAHFDKIMPLMRYPDFQRSLMTNRFMLEMCSYHTYGRTSVDTAALGIPSIGSNRVFSMRHCFPNMCADPFDGKKLYGIMKKTLTDDRWLQEQMDFAYDACEYFNYKHSEQRYRIMVEETHKRTGR